MMLNKCEADVVIEERLKQHESDPSWRGIIRNISLVEGSWYAERLAVYSCAEALATYRANQQPPQEATT
jgi:hypothetical protein